MGDLRELEKQIAAATGPTFALDQMIGEALVYPRAPFHKGII